MTERPILFSTPMVMAILTGAKTQTRRVMKSQPPVKPPECKPLKVATTLDDEGADLFAYAIGAGNGGWNVRCPYGVPGDWLWVRETWSMSGNGLVYKATDCDGSIKMLWRPSIFMKREYSRITLEIIDVRVQRVQEIDDTDALAEGVKSPRPDFPLLWDSINAKRAPWASNPFVWALTFRRVVP